MSYKTFRNIVLRGAVVALVFALLSVDLFDSHFWASFSVFLIGWTLGG